jgi:quercetin dioxygenase-like cupin family protein
MQLRGAEPVMLKPGEGFYEGPNDVHIVGRNASDSTPAKFVVFLVKNQGVPALIPVK